MKTQTLSWAALMLPLAASRVVENIQARDATCGVAGYDKGSPNAYGSYSIGTEECVVKCALSSKCLSFAVSDNECLLYSSSL